MHPWKLRWSETKKRGQIFKLRTVLNPVFTLNGGDKQAQISRFAEVGSVANLHSTRTRFGNGKGTEL